MHPSTKFTKHHPLYHTSSIPNRLGFLHYAQYSSTSPHATTLRHGTLPPSTSKGAPRISATNVQHLLAVAAALATFAAIIIRPRSFPEWASALTGAFLMLLLGIVPPYQAAKTLLANWNLFLFFFGLLSIATIADRAGIFDALAYLAGKLAKGNNRRLLINTFILGSIVTAFLSNDATVLILTPVMLTLTSRLGIPIRPYAFACAFIANIASVLLPVSNPTNIIVLDQFPAPLSDYLLHLFPGTVLSIIEITALFFIIFRSQIHGTFQLTRLEYDAKRQQMPFFRITLACLCITAATYIIAAAKELPLGIVAASSGFILLVLALSIGHQRPSLLIQEISWPLLLLVAGLLIVIQGLENTGVTIIIAQHVISNSTNVTRIFSSVLTGALTSNLINNLPATLVLTALIHHMPSTHAQHLLAYGTIVGVDIGPNMTVIGSLSSMLWLLILRRRNHQVTALDYIRIGLPISLINLATCTLCLWLTANL